MPNCEKLNKPQPTKEITTTHATTRWIVANVFIETECSYRTVLQFLGRASVLDCDGASAISGFTTSSSIAASKGSSLGTRRDVEQLGHLTFLLANLSGAEIVLTQFGQTTLMLILLLPTHQLTNSKNSRMIPHDTKKANPVGLASLKYATARDFPRRGSNIKFRTRFATRQQHGCSIVASSVWLQFRSGWGTPTFARPSTTTRT